ncbi:MAG: adenosylhomocysteinase [Bryobacteraceae bacterium]|nr:adenosylhomocysteinase [Bryobacteraceae bacterium]
MSANAEASAGYDVKDLALADAGRSSIDWAYQSMPVLQSVRKHFIRTQPFAGYRIAACLHVTPETANLMITLRDGGASVVLCASSPFTTDDGVAACLVRDYGIATFAVKDESDEMYHRHIMAAIDLRPHMTIDSGCDLVATLHSSRQDAIGDVIGGTEETATGVTRLQVMAREGVLQYPVVAVNDAATKHLFDNQYGTGQSTIEGILRATNVLLAGLKVVVAGYGWCGRGIAARARGLGANVIVTEVDPVKALEALMDGHRVMSMGEAAAIGDIFITATGNRSVINREHFDKFKDGAILCNAGHSNVEIDLGALQRAASSRKEARPSVDEYAMRDGRRLYVVDGGRLVNVASAEGHPAAVMDVTFANQAFAVEYILKHHRSLEKRVHPMPPELDRQVARMKLESMGVKIDKLSLEQEKYLSSWAEGA